MKRVSMRRTPFRGRRKPLRPRSKKMQAFYRDERVPAVKALTGGPCPVKSEVCTGKADTLHEIISRARAGGIMKAHRIEGNVIPACAACNSYISSHPAWAEEHGWLKRLSDASD